VTATPPEPPRRFAAPDGTVWEARIVASGRTSSYLAPRLTRPLVEFRCVTAPDAARRYAPFGGTTLESLDAEALHALWRRARLY